MMRDIGCLVIVLSLCGMSAPAVIAALPAEALFMTSDRCMACHNGLSASTGEDLSIGASWQGSMMANSSRDPYWQAGVRRETMEHAGARNAIEDECASCHMPMARVTATTPGNHGAVFAHLPIAPARGDEDALAADGVSCSMCHQITEEKLGTTQSFNAGFVVDTQKPPGERAVFGPFEVDAGRTRVMRSSSLMEPTHATHLKDAAFCASCHTLYTHSLGPDGNVTGEFPEQVPYLEWRHSAYEGRRSCQSCHMPELEADTPVTSVLGQPRRNFSRHLFRGGNFFVARILNRYRLELTVAALPQTFANVEDDTLAHLAADAARVEISAAGITNGRLDFEVTVRNLAGHKLPTAYPSRRIWLMATVRDRAGRVVFSSGALNPDGSISGNDNDADGTRHEPHHQRVTNQDQVQIYEAVLADHQGKVTTGLLSAVRYLKDNRVLPAGFDKASADKDVAVHGGALEDADFGDGGDAVHYSIAVNNADGPFGIEVALWYQPIGFRWAQNLAAYDAVETRRFVTYYRAMAPQSAAKLAAAERTVK